MRKYSHLTYNDRTIIERMCKANKKKKDIAQALGKSPATISKEIQGWRWRFVQAFIFAKKKWKKYAKVDHRGQIKNRFSIDERPEIVDLKRRYGDWEGDLIIGENHKSAMLVLVERKSKMTKKVVFILEQQAVAKATLCYS